MKPTMTNYEHQKLMHIILHELIYRDCFLRLQIYHGQITLFTKKKIKIKLPGQVDCLFLQKSRLKMDILKLTIKDLFEITPDIEFYWE
jgi:hypothetical protein